MGTRTGLRGFRSLWGFEGSGEFGFMKGRGEGKVGFRDGSFRKGRFRKVRISKGRFMKRRSW